MTFQQWCFTMWLYTFHNDDYNNYSRNYLADCQGRMLYWMNPSVQARWEEFTGKSRKFKGEY